jgi:hypothetical protein
MGGDKRGNGGLIDVNDDWASGIDLGAKAVGFYFGGPQGAAMASQGSKMLFGSDSDASSKVGKINKVADVGMKAGNIASAAQGGGGAESGGGIGDIAKMFTGGNNQDKLPDNVGITMPGDEGYAKWGVEPQKDDMTQTILQSMTKVQDQMKKIDAKFEKDPQMPGLTVNTPELPDDLLNFQAPQLNPTNIYMNPQSARLLEQRGVNRRYI